MNYREMPPEKLIERIHELEQQLAMAKRPSLWRRFRVWLAALRAPAEPKWLGWHIERVERVRIGSGEHVHVAHLVRERSDGHRAPARCISETTIFWYWEDGERVGEPLESRIERFSKTQDMHAKHKALMARVAAADRVAKS